MGWKSTIFAGLVAAATMASAALQPAQAGGLRWMMCWVPGESAGGHECVKLPDSWHITGVKKAYCQKGYYRCTNSAVTFQITRGNLHSVQRYAHVTTLDLGAVATIYSGVYK